MHVPMSLADEVEQTSSRRHELAEEWNRCETFALLNTASLETTAFLLLRYWVELLAVGAPFWQRFAGPQ